MRKTTKTATNAKRAIVYLRVSTEEQAASGAGLSAQRAACAEWAARNGVVIVAEHSDDGASGKALAGEALEEVVAHRPALLAALGEIKRGDVLLVAKRDRLSRDPFAAGAIHRRVESKGARIVSAAGEGDGEGSTALLMRRMIDAFGEFERLVIAERTSSALKAIRASGRKTGGDVPYGYRTGDDGRTLVAFEPEQRVIAEVRRLRDEGRSLREIGASLAAAGMLARNGKPLAAQTVANMLRA